MKRKKMLMHMDLIDDEFITEAAPKRKERRHFRTLAVLIAACLVISVIIGGLAIAFSINGKGDKQTNLPDSENPPYIEQYADSEYYEIIKKIYAEASKPAEDSDSGQNTAPKDEYPADMLPSNGEMTETPIAGVIEGNLIKRSDKYIYYLCGNTIRVCTIDGENSVEAGSYTINDISVNSEWDIHLSEDGKTVTVIAPSYRGVDATYLIQLDVSNPENITEKNRVSVAGYQDVSPSFTNGKILVFSIYFIDYQNLDFSDKSTFLPWVETKDGVSYIPASNIGTPEMYMDDYTCYTVVSEFDENTLAYIDSHAVFTYANHMYVSTDKIFIALTVFKRTISREENYDISFSTSGIYGLSYSGNTLTFLGIADIDGYLIGQECMDEYNGILRVMSSINRGEKYYNDDIDNSVYSASLYCIDPDTMQIIGSLERLVPNRNFLEEVHFDKNIVYVRTKDYSTADSMFIIDMNDINNITCSYAGATPRFSLSSKSFVNIGDGYLLYIGQGERSSTLRIEIYEKTEDGIVSVCEYEIQDAVYSFNNEAYYIDRENRLIGFGVGLYKFTSNFSPEHDDDHEVEYEYEKHYILLSFEDSELKVIEEFPISGLPSSMRTLYIDGYLYLFGYEVSGQSEYSFEFKVIPVNK